MGFEQTAGTGNVQLAEAQPGRKSDLEVESGSLRDAHRRRGLARGSNCVPGMSANRGKTLFIFEEKDRYFSSDLTL